MLFFFIDRCPQFTIKRGNVRQYLYGLCSNEIRSSREKKKRKIFVSLSRMIQYARSLIVGLTRRMTDTKACKRYAVRARIGRTSWLPKQLWRYTWWWITACPGSLVRRLCFSFRFDRPLDSIARFNVARFQLTRSSFVLFFFFFII